MLPVYDSCLQIKEDLGSWQAFQHTTVTSWQETSQSEPELPLSLVVCTNAKKKNCELKAVKISFKTVSTNKKEKKNRLVKFMKKNWDFYRIVFSFLSAVEECAFYCFSVIVFGMRLTFLFIKIPFAKNRSRTNQTNTLETVFIFKCWWPDKLAWRHFNADDVTIKKKAETINSTNGK